MHMKNMKKLIILFTTITFIGIGSIIGIVSMAQGHMLWLNASNYSPRIGEKVIIEIGFGHKYPHIGPIREESVEGIFIRDPKGMEMPIERVSSGKYQFSAKDEGRYEIIVKFRPVFVSNTTEGRKPGNRKTLANVVSCSHYTMHAKALINVGAEGGSSSQQNDLPLEFLLPENMNQLKVGDDLVAKVMYQGKPISGAKIVATDEKTALEQEGKWVVESETDAKGIVRIKMTSQGPWLINASYAVPFTDKSECDTSTYRMTLTFSLE